jgi:uncharacterized lipoprotein YddW (UPF0748 family)
MHRLILIFITITMLISTVVGQTNNTEFRATWVITWEHINRYDSVEENMARIRQIMDNHVAANMNAVLWQARQSGTAYYSSSYEPWGYYAGEVYPGYDPLEYAIGQAHLRGLELHAWVNAFQAASTSVGTPSYEHPEWVCRDQSGIAMPSYRALSPGLPEVRNYLKNVVMEIVNNYDVDGIHLDYVRWNEYDNLLSSREEISEVEQIRKLDGDISQDDLDALLNPQSGRYLYDVNHPYNSGVPSGFSSWEDWWRSSVTSFVESVHDSIQVVKPHVRLSAAALGKYNWSGWNGYNVVYQDAALWFNEGYIDQLTPMHYHWTTSSGFYGMLEGDCPNCWSQFIQPGIAAGRLFSVGPGSYILAENNVWSRHSSIVNSSRTVSWVDGFQFFSYGSWQDYQYWPIAGESFFDQKTKIRPINNNSTPPMQPALSINQINSLEYFITLTPNDTEMANMWNILYRSTDANGTTENSEVYGVYFGYEPIVVNESFDGTQDHNDSYYYFASTANRYWNESIVSNTSASAPLISYPPVVTSTLPQNDAIVSVNSPIEIQFSKTMSTVIPDGAITITPLITDQSYTWNATQKILQIHHSQHLNFNEIYTILINESLADINGRSFDGDGDGLEGGSYSFSFSTMSEDISGPIIIQSVPPLDGSEESFFNDGVFTLVFDELVDHASINLDNISVDNNQMTNFQLLKVDMNNQTIVSFKQYDPINPGNSYLSIYPAIADTLGNVMTETLLIPFTVSEYGLGTTTLIDAFLSSGNWWDPEGSGSTIGTIGGETVFGYSNSIYIPASSPYPSGLKSSYINYSWDTSASTHLLREYLSGGAPRNILFNATQTLQCYVFGDGSNNKFRFAIDEGDGFSWPGHEVSTWFDINWVGWKLIEWDLSDPTQVGNWIGNGILDATDYRFDSFQMTWNGETNATSGRIYLDELRVVSKVSLLNVGDKEPIAIEAFSLGNPYPNPFNASIRIPFYLPSNGPVSLRIIDPIGREIDDIQNGYQNAGDHEVVWNAANLSSGVYFVVAQYGNVTSTKRILMIK